MVILNYSLGNIKLLAPVARRLWLVLIEIPASALISFIKEAREFFPTDFSSYHGTSGSEGHFNFGRKYSRSFSNAYLGRRFMY